ncbi:MAG TPA: hypothetical protein VLV86_23240 [Vicinamibacterales bacterium]|nr:hypothetical protein [Vicinamibacterales bacterium]
MRRTWGSVIVMALVAIAIAMPAVPADRTHAVTMSNRLQVAADAQARLSKIYTADQLQKGVYVGSNFCLACHTDKASYLGTAHANFLRKPMAQYSLQPGKGVIADYDKNGVDDFIQGVDFNKVSGTVFDKYKPNAPILSVENGTYFITVGSLKMPLVFTVAGDKSGNAQRYVVRVPVTDTANGFSSAVYYGPFTYDPKAGYAIGSGWYDTTTFAPKFSAGIGSAALVATGGPSSHTAGCVGCHATGLQSMSKTASGETKAALWKGVLFAGDDPSYIDYDNDGQVELTNIGCEACHGPGSFHILGAGDPTKIANPAKMTAAQQADICGRCHVTGKSVPTGSYNWPFNDATNTNWTPIDSMNGVALSTFYTSTEKYWPDGTANGGRQYDQYLQALHLTNPYDKLGCGTCHDAHNGGSGSLLRATMTEGNVTVKTSAEDNSLCLSCHATHGDFANFTTQDVADSANGNQDATDKIAKVVAKHTNHPYAPERIMGLSNCTGCHMAAAGHTFKVISPQVTLQYQDKGGVPNTCAAGCHNNRVDIFNVGVKGSATTWNNQFDVTLSNLLKAYYGDGGKWWDTKQ